MAFVFSGTGASSNDVDTEFGMEKGTKQNRVAYDKHLLCSYQLYVARSVSGVKVNPYLSCRHEPIGISSSFCILDSLILLGFFDPGRKSRLIRTKGDFSKIQLMI